MNWTEGREAVGIDQKRGERRREEKNQRGLKRQRLRGRKNSIYGLALGAPGEHVESNTTKKKQSKESGERKQDWGGRKMKQKGSKSEAGENIITTGH